MLSPNLLAAYSLSLILLLIQNFAFAGHPLLIQGKGKLEVVDADGEVQWSMAWPAIHDVHVLDNGNYLLPRHNNEICEIDPKSKEIVWSYNSAKSNGNEGKRVEVHAFQPLADGNVMIVESGPARILEINRKGEIQKEVKLKVDHPHPHTDTRLARKLESGNYLVCHEADGTLREYDGESGDMVWEYQVPMFDKQARGGHGPEAFGNKLFSAVRLENGNTLIATGNGHSVLEVTPKKEIVWQIHQNDLDGITLAWVTTLEVLPNGNYVIGNCHAGKDNPQLIEIEPKSKKVIWTFNEFDRYGNDVSNTQLLEVETRR